MTSSSTHTFEFVCEDCGIDVIQLGYHDGLSVCGVCRFIRTVPNMSENTKSFLRGESTEEVTLAMKRDDDDNK